MSASLRHRRILDGSADANVGGASTDIAVHGEIDVAIIGLRNLAQQRDRAHHLPGLTIAALRHVAIGPGALYRIGLASRYGFDGRHFAVSERRNRQRARAPRTHVENT